MRLNKQTFLYSASIMAVSNAGLQILGFFYRVALSRLAGAEGLGVYRLAFSVYTIINAACLSGVTLACARLSAEKFAQGKPEQIRALMRMAMGVFLLLFTICACVILPFHEWIASKLLGDIRTEQALPIMFVCLFLTGIENIIKSIFIGMNTVKFAAVSETGEQIIRIIAVVSLLTVFGGKDYGRIAALIMLGMALSECFSSTFLSILYRKKIGTLPKPIRADSGLLKKTLDIALPLSLAAVFSNGIASASAVILPQRLIVAGLTEGQAIAELGIVSGMALPLILLPIALISAVGTVLVPSVTAAQARHDMARVRALSRKALLVTGFIALPATGAIIPLAPSLSRLFFYQSLPLIYMLLLGISAIFSYYQMITASLLNGLGQQRRAVIAAVCGEAVQLALTWILAAKPQLGIYGYLLAMLISPIGVVCANLHSLCSYTKLKLTPAHTFGAPALCGIMVYLWVRVFYAFFLGIVGAQWMAALLSAGGAVILNMLLLRMLGIHVWQYIAKRWDKTQAATIPMFTFL